MALDPQGHRSLTTMHLMNKMITQHVAYESYVCHGGMRGQYFSIQVEKKDIFK